MIVVIADDLSGAAELAEAARRWGLVSEVHTRFDSGVAADLVCVDAGTRALAPEDAARVMTTVVREVTAAAPEWIYLKFDSVLRGNVRVELCAALAATGDARALLVPANPWRGRTIRAGRYLIEGVPLNETPFAADPEHPRRCAEVTEILGGDLSRVAVPDAESHKDLERLAAGAEAGSLVAGAAEFFEALLRRRSARRAGECPPDADEAAASGPAITLLVCGSRASWSTRRGEAKARGMGVFDLEGDPERVARALEGDGVALVGIGEVSAGAAHSSSKLVALLAERVSAIARRVRVDRLLLEGGATAAAVVRRAGWTRFLAVPGGGPGTGALRPTGQDRPTLFIKPGSYPWPRTLWLSDVGEIRPL